VKEASGKVGMYTNENLAPQIIGIATEIVSISVSVDDCHRTCYNVAHMG